MKYKIILAMLIFLSVIALVFSYPADENTDVEYKSIRNYIIYPYNKYMLDRNGELKETKDILHIEYKYPNFVMSWESTTGKHQYTFSFVPVYKSNNLETTFNNLILADSSFKVSSTINDLSDGKEFYYSMENIPKEVGYFKLIIEPKAESFNQMYMLPDKLRLDYSDLSNFYNLQSGKDGDLLLYPKSSDWLPMESFDPYFKVSSMNFDATVTYNDDTENYVMSNATSPVNIGTGLTISSIGTYARTGMDPDIAAIPHNCLILNVSMIIFFNNLPTTNNDKRDFRFYFNYPIANATNGTSEARWNIWGMKNNLMLNANFSAADANAKNTFYLNSSANRIMNNLLHTTSNNNLFSIALHTSEDGDPDMIGHTMGTMNSSHASAATVPYLNISCAIQDVI